MVKRIIRTWQVLIVKGGRYNVSAYYIAVALIVLPLTFLILAGLLAVGVRQIELIIKILPLVLFSVILIVIPKNKVENIDITQQEKKIYLISYIIIFLLSITCFLLLK